MGSSSEESDSSMNASILEKLADYIYDDESDMNVIRRILYTGLCSAFPDTPGGECGALVTREEMMRVDQEKGFMCSTCQGPYKPLDTVLDVESDIIDRTNENSNRISKKSRKGNRSRKFRDNYEVQYDKYEEEISLKSSKKKKNKNKKKSSSNRKAKQLHSTKEKGK